MKRNLKGFSGPISDRFAKVLRYAQAGTAAGCHKARTEIVGIVSRGPPSRIEDRFLKRTLRFVKAACPRDAKIAGEAATPKFVDQVIDLERAGARFAPCIKAKQTLDTMLGLRAKGAFSFRTKGAIKKYEKICGEVLEDLGVPPASSHDMGINSLDKARRDKARQSAAFVASLARAHNSLTPEVRRRRDYELAKVVGEREDTGGSFSPWEIERVRGIRRWEMEQRLAKQGITPETSASAAEYNKYFKKAKLSKAKPIAPGEPMTTAEAKRAKPRTDASAERLIAWADSAKRRGESYFIDRPVKKGNRYVKAGTKMRYTAGKGRKPRAIR